MKKLLTAAFAIVAALVALSSALTETTGRYQHASQPRDRYEIAIMNNVAASRQIAMNLKHVDYEEPA